jgi:transcriptional regulator with XRE-family HTH domain
MSPELDDGSIRRTPPPELGPILKAARLRHGLGLREAARAARISHCYLRRLEIGERCPSAAVVVELLRVLPLDEREAALLSAAGLSDRGRSHPLRAPSRQ